MGKNRALIDVLAQLRDKRVRVYLSCGRDLHGVVKSIGDVVILERHERRFPDGSSRGLAPAEEGPKLWVSTFDIVAVEEDHE